MVSRRIRVASCRAGHESRPCAAPALRQPALRRVQHTAKGTPYTSAVRERGAELEVAAPVKLFDIDVSERAGGNYFALSADGNRIAVNLAGRTAGRPLTVMVNWMSGLARDPR
jgi:hypothetical protein